jgi:hypothetical protein
MQSKKKALDSIHKGDKKAESLYQGQNVEFDYGPLKNMLRFKETHPAVMADKMKDFSWKSSLNYSNNEKPNRPLFKHEKLKYKAISWAERNLNGGKHFFPFKNWKVLDI